MVPSKLTLPVRAAFPLGQCPLFLQREQERTGAGGLCVSVEPRAVLTDTVPSFPHLSLSLKRRAFPVGNVYRTRGQCDYGNFLSKYFVINCFSQRGIKWRQQLKTPQFSLSVCLWSWSQVWGHMLAIPTRGSWGMEAGGSDVRSHLCYITNGSLAGAT